MAVEFMPFKPTAAVGLRLQESQAIDGFGTEQWPLERWQALASQSAVSWQASYGDRFLGCAGIIPIWKGRAFAWMAISVEVAQPHMLAIHRRTASVLETAQRMGFRRLETTVRSDYGKGHRWALMLGFKREGTMRYYAPDGADHDLYARIG